MARLDLIVHPVRSRIVGAVAGRELTTRQLARALPDVPVPTLYRHVRTLEEAGILVRASERKVRGAVERSYILAEGGGRLDPDAILSAEDRLAALANFGNLVVHAYRTYVEAGGEEIARAGMRSLYLTDEELVSLREGMNALLAPYHAHGPGEGRRRRLLSIIDQPDFEPASDEEPT